MAQQLLFSTFDVTRQVFFRSSLSYGAVNLKPIVPGHVLVIPKRVVSRLSDLSPEEIADLFGSASKIGVAVEKAFSAQSLTVSCQDGPAAGQSVPHVHIHVLPRRFTDFGGQNDQVYPELEELEGNLPEIHKRARVGDNGRQSPSWVDDESRTPRSMEEMEKEARWLSTYFQAGT